MAAEQSLVAPSLQKDDYFNGTAQAEDEIAVFHGNNPVLFTAEHATIHYRTESGRRRTKAQDLGTAGLGCVLAHDLNAHFMVMPGRQTSDANFEPNHEFKAKMKEVIAKHNVNTVITLHGMRSGKFTSFTDSRAHDILLGIGLQPNQASLALAAHAERVARRFGLRCSTNERFVQVANDYPLQPKTNSDGAIIFDSFVAPHYTTRAAAQAAGEDADREIAAVQIELSDLLRFILPEIKPRDERTRQIGTYLGYSIIRESLMASENQSC